MRRATTIGLIGLALLLCAARPASAQWRIIKWLEELSGPGPFTIQALSGSLFCQDSEGKLLATTWENWGICDQNPVARTTTADWKKVRNYWTVTWGKGSGANNLDYQGEKRDDVSAWLFNAGPAYRASPFTDIGATIGFVHFSVPTVEPVYKVTLDGYLVLRPFAAASGKLGKVGQVFAIRLNTTYFPQGFTLADFGASGGAVLDGKAELISSVVFEVNFLHWR